MKLYCGSIGVMPPKLSYAIRIYKIVLNMIHHRLVGRATAIDDRFLLEINGGAVVKSCRSAKKRHFPATVKHKRNAYKIFITVITAYKVAGHRFSVGIVFLDRKRYFAALKNLINV